MSFPLSSDPQTPPPPPSHGVEPDSHPLHNASAPEATPLLAPDVSDDFKRQNETALSWSYVLIAIFFTLRVNSPNLAYYSRDLAYCYPNRAYYYPDLIVLCAATAILEYLCLFTAVGIFYYSSTGQPSAELAKAQKTVLTSSKLILLLDFLCRLALTFPFLPFLPITVAAAAKWILLPYFLYGLAHLFPSLSFRPITVAAAAKWIHLLYFLYGLARRFPFLAITVAAAVLARLVLFPLHRAHVSTPAAHR